MQQDFQHFVNHSGISNEENDPLNGHLFNLKDAKWRNMRIKLTPTFTSGKMKMMFQTLADCTIGLKDVMDDSATHQKPVDIKDILGRFTTDIIGSVAFGLECNTIKNPDALFRKYATNPDIQDKLRDEINTVLAKHNDELTYEGMMEMTYMEQVLHETLREYPPLPLLTRTCTKDYTIPNTSIRIKKGVEVGIPVIAIHTDPEYYPDPMRFDPERFSEENKKMRHTFTWIPFGEGPRLCIGLRFGMLQSKVGLTTLLKNYKIKVSKMTKVPLQFDKSVSCDLTTIATTILDCISENEINILELEPPTLSPTISLDDVKKVLLGLITFGEQFQEFRKKFKCRGYKHGGVYVILLGTYISIDPEIIFHKNAFNISLTI
ncbi:p450 domain containing protein [Asbolus verrucosus]|uniref:p450 domain containing protein n=1 Tax=Asbolus verrucosus TaxID=1661398 RepID=A0A482VU21_ASBVE|nr:p450 domain containing protein [Asbolus verrucosus]